MERGGNTIRQSVDYDDLSLCSVSERDFLVSLCIKSIKVHYILKIDCVNNMFPSDSQSDEDRDRQQNPLPDKRLVGVCV